MSRFFIPIFRFGDNMWCIDDGLVEKLELPTCEDMQMFTFNSMCYDKDLADRLRTGDDPLKWVQQINQDLMSKSASKC